MRKSYSINITQEGLKQFNSPNYGNTKQGLQHKKKRSLSVLQQQLQQEKQQDVLEKPKVLANLYSLQENIVTKMVELDSLNCQYFEKQEKYFFKAFINMMDRMSNQLLETKIKYDNIDQEIDRDIQCVELSQKLKFFKDESLFLSNQLRSIEKQLQQYTSSNEHNQELNRTLKEKLVRETKSEHKYKHRKNSLQQRIQQNSVDKIKYFSKSKQKPNNDGEKSFFTQSAYGHRAKTDQKTVGRIHTRAKTSTKITTKAFNQLKSEKCFEINIKQPKCTQFEEKEIQINFQGASMTNRERRYSRTINTKASMRKRVAECQNNNLLGVAGINTQPESKKDIKK